MAKIRRREDARAQADVTDDDWQHHEVDEEEGVDEEERLAGMTFGRMARERRGVVEEKSAVKDDEADEDEDDKDAGALMMGLVDSIHRSGSHHVSMTNSSGSQWVSSLGPQQRWFVKVLGC